MAINLGEDFLLEVGLACFPEPVKRTFLDEVYEELNMRVGRRLVNQLTRSQLDEFETFVHGDEVDDEAGLRWLQCNVPGYKEVVHREFDLLKGEIRLRAQEALEAEMALESGGAA